MKRVRLGLAIAIIFLSASTALAQARPSKWELAPGVIWFSGMDLGTSTATLERPGGGEFELFTADTRLDAAIGAGTSLSFYLGPRLVLEAAFSYARPSASTRVSADAEDAPDVTSTIGLQQYLIEGNVRWYPRRSAGRTRTFIRAGGGYLRQLDDSNAHVETGKTIQVGVGLDRAFRERAVGTLRRVGLRVDARVLARSGGFDVDDTLRIGFSAGAALFLGF